MTDEIHNLSKFYRDEDTLTDKERAKKVFYLVLVGHLVFIAGPFLVFALWEKIQDKKPVPMQVSLLNLNPDNGKTDEAPGNPPPSPKEEPKTSKTDEPQSEPEEAVPTPPVETPKNPVVEPAAKPDKVKVPVEKPTPKPTPKTVDTKKVTEPKKPSVIKKSDKVVKGKPLPSTSPAKNARDLADRLRKIQNQCKVTGTGTGTGAGTPTGSPSGNPNVTGAMKAGYYEKVQMFLYDLWDQPSKAELNNQKPSVTIHISVDASGSVRSASIVKRSGIPVMDSSVEALLARLRTVPLPKPPNGAEEFDALMGIDGN